MKLRIATRKSPLALKQTDLVIQKLTSQCPFLDPELVPISTQGDQIQHKTLHDLGGKALFMKELEYALLSDHADIAVHSLKDIPYELPEPFQIAAVLDREDPRDVLITNHDETFETLPQGSRIGTSSLRRQSQMLANRSDLVISSIRGNIGTRIQKLRDQRFDGIVVAAAGVKRMGYEHQISQYLGPDVVIPGIGQGVIAIETKRDQSIINENLQRIHNHSVYECICAEREFNRYLKGNCSSAIGAHAYWETNGTIRLNGMVGEPTGQTICAATQSHADPWVLGKQVADEIFQQGGHHLL